jgi:hypothetical protein
MNQKTGDNSTNIGVAGDIVYQVGVSEQRVREIFDEKINIAVAQFSNEAKVIATERINNFLTILLPRMSEAGALGAFLDPDFQLLLIEAQKSAASTEREPDIKLLTELLVHRFNKKDDRSAKIGISKAVSIVHQIPDQALLGLTVFYAVTQISPKTGNIEQGLDILDGLFQRIIYDTLPEGTSWLDDLYVLGAIRFVGFVGFDEVKKMEEYYPYHLLGYTCEGVLENSVQHNEIINIFRENNINPEGLLVNHILSMNYLRLNIASKESIKDLYSKKTSGQTTKVNLTEQQRQVLITIAEKYMKIDTPYQQNIAPFMKLWNERPHLKLLKRWWNKINIPINITSVGRVLAHANAQRCDNRLPSLD